MIAESPGLMDAKGLAEFLAMDRIPEAQAREVLHTIPGVGTGTVEAFLSEVGDVSRFGSQKQVAAYAGLSPGQRESAGRVKELNITHRGSRWLRWALNQASWQWVRRDLRWRTIFESSAYQPEAPARSMVQPSPPSPGDSCGSCG